MPKMWFLTELLSSVVEHTFGFYRFGRFIDDVLDYTIAEIPLFFLIGAIGGAVGAFYVYASAKIIFYRKR